MPDDGPATARAIGLRYVRPYDDPGFTRAKHGRGFRYLDRRGRALRDAATLDRVRALVIPPAWTRVWIARDPRAHIQATGVDAKARRQYVYHPHWRTARDDAKYGRLAAFCRELPGLRRRVARDLACDCLCRESVAATVIALIESGHLRVGNDVYARTNRSYGATTLECRHLRLHGDRIELSYVGKSGVAHRVAIEDAGIARVVRKCRALPGRRLFQYRDRSGAHAISSSDVNGYLRGSVGAAYSAKDFRTWAATLWCALLLGHEDPPTGVTAARRAVRTAIREVADRLGHTPAVCRSSYVHPGVLAGFADGRLQAALPASLRTRAVRGVRDLRAAERHLIPLLVKTQVRARGAATATAR